MTLIIALSIIAITAGAILGRIDGGGLVKMHEQIERALIVAFFIAACVPFAGWWAISSYIGVAGIATGHGQYFLVREVKALSGERMEFIVRLFFGDDPRTDIRYLQYRDDAHIYMPDDVRAEIAERMNDYGMTKMYWRGVIGFFITGQLLGIPAMCLALWFDEPLVAALFSLTGIAKALAYVIGYAFFAKGGDRGTVAGEYINGGLRSALCVAAFLMVV